MDLDRFIPRGALNRVEHLLRSAGFEPTPELLADRNIRTITWTLGGASPQRRKTVLELISLVLEDEAA